MEAKNFKKINGGRTRTRTWDPLIKSQLLYQLSYAPGIAAAELPGGGLLAKADGAVQQGPARGALDETGPRGAGSRGAPRAFAERGLAVSAAQRCPATVSTSAETRRPAEKSRRNGSGGFSNSGLHVRDFAPPRRLRVPPHCG